MKMMGSEDPDLFYINENIKNNFTPSMNEISGSFDEPKN